MGVTIQREDSGVVTLRIEGILRKPELDNVIWAEAGRLGPEARVRVLVLAKGFEGWEGKEEWGDVSFFMKYGDRIDRIAIVADRKWETDLMTFAAAGFRRAPVKFFAPDKVQEARTWLAGD